MSRWHLWLGSGARRRCEVCGTRWLVFRYTDGKLDVSACWRHRHVVPGQPGG
ncbi:MAG: hypothetical protein ACRDNZ_00935 [Streptosporangiaceae bacterium]